MKLKKIRAKLKNCLTAFFVMSMALPFAAEGTDTIDVLPVLPSEEQSVSDTDLIQYGEESGPDMDLIQYGEDAISDEDLFWEDKANSDLIVPEEDLTVDPSENLSEDLPAEADTAIRQAGDLPEDDPLIFEAAGADEYIGEESPQPLASSDYDEYNYLCYEIYFTIISEFEDGGPVMGYIDGGLTYLNRTSAQETVTIPEQHVCLEITDAQKETYRTYGTIPSFEATIDRDWITFPAMYILLEWQGQAYYVETKVWSAQLCTQEEVDMEFVSVAPMTGLVARTGNPTESLGESASGGNSSSDHPVISFLKTLKETVTEAVKETVSGNGGTTVVKKTSDTGRTTTVKKSAPKVTPRVYLSQAGTLYLTLGKTFSGLRAAGMIAGDAIASWRSSNSAVVRVNASGKLTARKAGTALVTVTTKMGAKASLTVRVKNPTIRTSTKSVKLSLKKKKKYSLGVSGLMYGDKVVSFRSSNPAVAKVSQKGLIRAVSKGTARITVRSRYGAVTTVKVTVKKR